MGADSEAVVSHGVSEPKHSEKDVNTGKLWPLWSHADREGDLHRKVPGVKKLEHESGECISAGRQSSGSDWNPSRVKRASTWGTQVGNIPEQGVRTQDGKEGILVGTAVGMGCWSPSGVKEGVCVN